MISKDFLKSGHTPTLVSAFLYFDMSFMVWVLLGSLGVAIAKEMGLNPAQKGLMVAIPVLAGALFRVVNGVVVTPITKELPISWATAPTAALKLEVRGGQVRGYLNGRMICSELETSPLTGGSAGVITSNSKGTFANLLVTQLNP